MTYLTLCCGSYFIWCCGDYFSNTRSLTLPLISSFLNLIQRYGSSTMKVSFLKVTQNSIFFYHRFQAYHSKIFTRWLHISFLQLKYDFESRWNPLILDHTNMPIYYLSLYTSPTLTFLKKKHLLFQTSWFFPFSNILETLQEPNKYLYFRVYHMHCQKYIGDYSFHSKDLIQLL